MGTGFAALCACWLVFTAAGCGHAPAAPDEAALNRGFAELQRHEARLDAARSIAARDTEPCATRCAAREALSDARDRICALADELQDPDALSRCAQARHSAVSGVARLDAVCECTAAGS